MAGLLDQGQSETPTPTPAPAGSPPDGDQQQSEPVARPDGVPEELWSDTGFNAAAFETLKAGNKAEDLPDAPEGYVIPAVEGFDAEKAAASPIFAVLRSAAHGAGIGQAGFDKLVSDYVAGETAKIDEQTTAEMALLGANAKARLGAVGAFLNGNLPADLAAAVGATLTTAKAVQGIEKLMSLGKPGGGPRGEAPPGPTRKTKAEIDRVMQSKEYSGKEAERDPKVIAEVDAWFQAEYGEKK
jgi:hypothetical protein